ncbi:MAG: T9SS type A sorting domain-containing protein [Crocinitomicaceae bacterium]|nr:T9SS type A sorting domain-containing protein [Crocinitomicaceae bacterium]
MKVSHILSVLAFFLFNHVHAQWFPLNSGVTEALNDIHMVTGDIGYTVGDNGTMIKTMDAGVTWNNLAAPTNQTLRSVYFLNENHGFICGEEGLFETTNGGLNWSLRTLSANTNLHHLDFYNDTTGFCTGGDYSIYKTIDGGFTWNQKSVNTNGTSNPVSDLSFPTENVGYGVCSEGSWSILMTTDGGETWDQDTIGPFGSLCNLEAVHFTNLTDGFIGGWDYQTFIKTEDAGNVWTSDAQLWAIEVHDIDFFDSNNGIIAGEQGYVYETNDGGVTWSGNDILSSAHKWIDGGFDPLGNAFVVGENGQIYKNELLLSSQELEAIDVSLWPNPANEFVYVSADQAIRRIVVSDLSGRTVFSKDELMLGQIRIDLPRQNGVYILTLTFESGVTTSKRVIKN